MPSIQNPEVAHGFLAYNGVFAIPGAPVYLVSPAELGVVPNLGEASGMQNLSNPIALSLWTEEKHRSIHNLHGTLKVLVASLLSTIRHYEDSFHPTITQKS